MNQPDQRQFRIPMAIMGNFEIHKLNFLKNKLHFNSPKFSRAEWNSYLYWYFEASQHYQESKIDFLQKKDLKIS